MKKLLQYMVIYPKEINKKQSEYYFIKGADCWGWATWKELGYLIKMEVD